MNYRNRNTPYAFKIETVKWRLNCIVVLWPDYTNGLPVAILNRSNIKKGEDIGHLKRGKEYSVQLNDSSLFERAMLIFNGDYFDYAPISNFLIIIELSKKEKRYN